MAVKQSTGFASQILGPRSFDQIFDGGCIEIRSGAQPDSADLAATGALLARITRDGLPWAPGNGVNGLRYARDGRFAVRAYTDRWRLSGIATGVAGWFRLVGRSHVDGDSLTEARIDGVILMSPPDGVFPDADFQMVLPSVQITPATAMPIEQWSYFIP